MLLGVYILALVILPCSVQTLVRRGLYATALENGKLLMTLNEEDPTGITLCIDYIALRAGQYSFIQVGLPDVPHQLHLNLFINFCSRSWHASSILCIIRRSSHGA